MGVEKTCVDRIGIEFVGQGFIELTVGACQLVVFENCERT